MPINAPTPMVIQFPIKPRLIRPSIYFPFVILLALIGTGFFTVALITAGNLFTFPIYAAFISSFCSTQFLACG